MSTPALTPKQGRCVDEYLIDLNATQAAIRAGYSVNSAAQIGEENLRKPDIHSAIQNQIAERSQRTKRTSDSVLSDLEAIKASAMQLVRDKDGNHVMANPNAALKSLELEGKHLGMWAEKQPDNSRSDTGEAIAALIAMLPN